MTRSRLLATVTSLLTIVLAAPAAATDTPPANDNFANAQYVDGLSQPAPEDFTTQYATKEPGELSAFAPFDHTVWFKWTPNLSGAVLLDTCDSAGDGNPVAAYAVHEGKPKTIANVYWANLADEYPLPEHGFCHHRFRATGGRTYWIQVIGDGAPAQRDLQIVQDVQKPTATPDFGWGDTTAPGHVYSLSGVGAAEHVVCAVDGEHWTICDGPIPVSGLAAGEHVMTARLMDAAGNLGPQAVKKWTVQKPAPAPAEPAEGQPTPPPTPSEPATVPAVTPAAQPCTTKLAAPRRVALARLRRGLRVKVTSTCPARLSLTQRGRRLAARGVPGSAVVVVRARRARRGRVALSAGGARAIVKVV
jgi:hypothetical protein